MCSTAKRALLKNGSFSGPVFGPCWCVAGTVLHSFDSLIPNLRPIAAQIDVVHTKVSTILISSQGLYCCWLFVRREVAMAEASMRELGVQVDGRHLGD